MQITVKIFAVTSSSLSLHKKVLISHYQFIVPHTEQDSESYSASFLFEADVLHCKKFEKEE